MRKPDGYWKDLIDDTIIFWWFIQENIWFKIKMDAHYECCEKQQGLFVKSINHKNFKI